MEILFWITAMVCCSLANADCTSSTSCKNNKTRHIGNMQKAACNCTKFVKDHAEDEHCIDFRFKIDHWVNLTGSTQTVTGSQWPHCAPKVDHESEEMRKYVWIAVAAKSYQEKKLGSELEMSGIQCYVLVLILTFLLFVLVAAIFQQQKRKNITIKDLESRIRIKNQEADNLSRTIKAYRRQYGPIEING